MKVFRIEKRLNNAELGKGNVHETYVRIPNGSDAYSIFENVGEKYIFIDEHTGDSYEFRYTMGREQRIVGLGDYYREKNLEAGDKIILEKIVYGAEIIYCVDTFKQPDVIVVQKGSKGFEILTKRLSNAGTKVDNSIVELKFLASEKKRSDSPEKTNFYDILINGKSLLNDKTLSSKDLVEIIPGRENAKVNKIVTYTQIKINAEER